MTNSRIPYPRRLVTAASLLLPNLAARLPSQHLRRGALKLLRLRMGRESAIYGGAEVRAPWCIRIGDFTSIGSNAVLDGRGGLTIGNCVNLSSEVMLWTNQHDYRDAGFAIVAGPIVIGDYAWLGPRAIVLPGVTIAEGCVIAAGGVVTRDTEPYGLYGGVPAKRIGERPRGLNYKPGRNYVPII